jgi:hypothetical protein
MVVWGDLTDIGGIKYYNGIPYTGTMTTPTGKTTYMVVGNTATLGDWNLWEDYNRLLGLHPEFFKTAANPSIEIPDIDVMPEIINDTSSKTTQGQGGIPPLLIAAGLVLAAVWLK